MLSRSELAPPVAAGDAGRLSEHRLAFGDTEVPYVYGVDCAPALADAILARLGDLDALLFVVDSRVGDHATPLVTELSRSVRVEVQAIHAREPDKTLTTVESIMDTAVTRRMTRRSAVVAMGGGTVGNLAGLAAAMLFRGTRLVHLPTTPVAAFDATISVKQGVNLKAGKNLCGTYFAPALIACDLAWLATVPRADLLTGLAEMVKNVLVASPHLEETLAAAIAALAGDRDSPFEALGRLLRVGVEAKAPYLRADPHERRAALVFEYGHTAGHAIEFASGGAIGHGEAVAWGMLAAAEVARRRHGLAAADVATHHRLVSLLDLPDPASRLAGLDRATLHAVIQADNKRGYAACGPDEVLMVLLAGVGRPLAAPAAGAQPPHGPSVAGAVTAGPPLVPVPAELLLDAIETVRHELPREEVTR